MLLKRSEKENGLQTSYLSRDGYNKLIAKLDYMLKVRRKEITADIAHAREFGDLRENAEYNAAKEAQAMNEIKISELTNKLRSARIIDDMDIPADKVYIGAKDNGNVDGQGSEIKYIDIMAKDAAEVYNLYSPRRSEITAFVNAVTICTVDD